MVPKWCDAISHRQTKRAVLFLHGPHEDAIRRLSARCVARVELAQYPIQYPIRSRHPLIVGIILVRQHHDADLLGRRIQRISAEAASGSGFVEKDRSLWRQGGDRKSVV